MGQPMRAEQAAMTPAGVQFAPVPRDAARPMTRGRGKLYVFLGIAPGAGKTYAMLAEGRRLADRGVDVVVGLAETHGRGDTDAMATALERVPQRQVGYRGTTFAELDVDALLARHPQVAVVDELAHACVPGCRHAKRWEDVQELLEAGIDVITALNVQHLESLNNAVEAVTSVRQAETVPNAVVAAADRVEFIDITPQQLRKRISGGGVLADRAGTALGGFYTPGTWPRCVPWPSAGWTNGTCWMPRRAPRSAARPHLPLAGTGSSRADRRAGG